MDEIQTEDLPEQNRHSDVQGPNQTNSKLHLSLASQFNIDHPNDKEDEKLKMIWEHGMKVSDSKDLFDVMWQVTHLRRTLGAPRLGESPLDRIYRYVKLRRTQEYVEDELRKI